MLLKRRKKKGIYSACAAWFYVMFVGGGWIFAQFSRKFAEICNNRRLLDTERGKNKHGKSEKKKHCQFDFCENVTLLLTPPPQKKKQTLVSIKIHPCLIGAMSNLYHHSSSSPHQLPCQRLVTHVRETSSYMPCPHRWRPKMSPKTWSERRGKRSRWCHYNNL